MEEKAEMGPKVQVGHLMERRVFHSYLEVVEEQRMEGTFVEVLAEARFGLRYRGRPFWMA